MILKISKEEGYLATIKLSTLLRGITSTHNTNFYRFELCENRDFCEIGIPSKGTKII